MTEAEITQALQTDLAQYRIKPIVKQKQSHLHILLNRPEEVTVDYGFLTKQVCTRLRSLDPPDVTLVTVYGRVSGQKEYEWEETRQLTAEETLVFDSAKMEEYLRELELAQASEEDEPPTEVYQPKASAAVPPEAFDIDNSEITLVAPQMNRSQPVSQEESEDSFASSAVPAKGPLAKPMIKILVGIGAAALVLLIALALF